MGMEVFISRIGRHCDCSLETTKPFRFAARKTDCEDGICTSGHSRVPFDLDSSNGDLA